MTNSARAAAPQGERLEIPAHALRDTIIRLLDTVGGSPEERSAFLRNPQEYLARLLAFGETRQLRVGSIDAILAALPRLADPVRDGTSTVLAQLVKQAFSTGLRELPDRGAAPYSTQNVVTFTYTYTWSSSFSTKKSGASDDPRLSPACLRAALEAYVQIGSV
jgi:hypothetical protein